MDGNDALVIESEIGELVQPQPLAYTMDAYGELTLLGWQPEYDVSGDEVTFTSFGSYSGTLVFEVNWGYKSNGISSNGNVEWCTYLGATADDWILDMTQSPSNALFVGGKTYSTNFAAVTGLTNITTQNAGDQDGFVARFAQDDHLEWFTYLGGSQEDAIQGLCFNEVASSNRLYYVGYLQSSDFGAIPSVDPGGGAFYKATSSGGRDAWFGRIDEYSGILSYGIYIGGNGLDDGRSIVCDEAGAVFVTGVTRSDVAMSVNSAACLAPSASEFPLCESSATNSYFQPAYRGNQDVFIMKINYLNQSKWCTYFGSDEYEEVYEINLLRQPDWVLNLPSSDILICGRTSKQSSGSNACGGNVPSSDFPLCNAGGLTTPYFDDRSGAFLTRFSNDGVLQWSSTFANIKVFQTITSSKSNFYAVGIKDQSGTGSSGCAPMTGNDIPICDVNGGYSQSDNVELYIAQFAKATNELTWSTLYGTDAIIDLYNPACPPNFYSKYMDAVATIGGQYDDYLFIHGTTQTEFDCYVDPGFTSWYLQTQNLSAPAGFTDSYILGFSPTQDRNWATLFGGGSAGASIPTCPRWCDYGSCAMLRDQTLFIGGYSGGLHGPGNFDPFPFKPETGAYFHDGTGTNDGPSLNLDGYIAKFNVDDMLVVSSEGREVRPIGIHLYPNPTTDAFAVELTYKNVKTSISVRDINGREIECRTGVFGENPSFDTRKYSSGVYVVTVASKGQTWVGKLIKI